MAGDPTDLAPLLGSRICHDLASPLGALMAGLDLLEMAGKPSEELALMRDSVEGARATLDLMRLAFGRAGDAESIAADTLHKVLSAPLAARPRLALDWALAGTLPRAQAQRLTLALLCALHALPRGGTLRVAQEGAALTLTVSGTIAADPALWEGLAGRAPLPVPDPRRIEFALLSGCLDNSDTQVSITYDAETLRISLSQAKGD